MVETAKRDLWDTEEKRYLFNVDRWMNYSRQKLHLPSTFAVTAKRVTPKQRRRMLKKRRKNQDYSIGIT